MTEIDYLETLKAIRLCVQNPHYKVGIFTRTMLEAERVCNDVMDAIFEDEEEKNAVEGANTALRSRIAFKNGSSIQFVRASENARGCRFNRVLYDKDINRDLLHTVVQHTEFRYGRSRQI